MDTLQFQNTQSKDLPGKSETLPEIYSSLVDAKMLTSLCGIWNCGCCFEKVIHHFKFHSFPKESANLFLGRK